MSITLYVNGDSHTAGTYINYVANLEECATALLAKKYKLNYINRARGGGSNARIIRITKDNLQNLNPKQTIVLIGWSTFERTEWFEKGVWHQICGQPWYNVSDSLKTQWKEYIEQSLENYHILAEEWQTKIYDFHLWLKDRGFAHRFYHGHNCFILEDNKKIIWPDNLWINNSAYKSEVSFTQHSISLGFNPDNYLHFNYDAHAEYAKVLDHAVVGMLEEIKK